jgi:hypothetical protein
MPVKRRLGKARGGAISPSTVAAYAHALALRAQHARGEVDLDAVAEGEKTVERMLSIKMWQPSVFDLKFWEPSDDLDYQRALDLRDRLDAALAAIRAKQTTAAAPPPEVETPVLADVAP